MYVTGLPDDTDADEVAGVFAKCGIVKLDDAGQPRIKLYRSDMGDTCWTCGKTSGLAGLLRDAAAAPAPAYQDGRPCRGAVCSTHRTSMSRFLRPRGA